MEKIPTKEKVEPEMKMGWNWSWHRVSNVGKSMPKPQSFIRILVPSIHIILLSLKHHYIYMHICGDW